MITEDRLKYIENSYTLQNGAYEETIAELIAEVRRLREAYDIQLDISRTFLEERSRLFRVAMVAKKLDDRRYTNQWGSVLDGDLRDLRQELKTIKDLLEET